MGKGTLFRRSGDRTELLRALCTQRSEQLRTILPDLVSAYADPGDRTVAVMDAVLRSKLDHRAISSALEGGSRGGPYDDATHRQWHRLLHAEVVAARGPAHADFIAHALLASVRAELVAHLGETGPAAMEVPPAACSAGEDPRPWCESLRRPRVARAR